ncbi:MAG: helix-turn-helix domain-containing protein, partial [Actinomycetota bacterium]
MQDVEVIEEPSVAAAVLDPLRAEVLAALAEPGSASTVAEALGQPRQKINYHVRALEQ